MQTFLSSYMITPSKRLLEVHMFLFNSIYKERNGTHIKALHLEIPRAQIVSIECTNAISDLIIDLMLGKEKPSKGSISEGFSGQIRVIYKEESYYMEQTVHYYLNLFSKLMGNKSSIDEIMEKMGLLDIGHYKIKKLNYSQKRRLSFARELLSPPKILIIQEPVSNLDRLSLNAIMDALNFLSDKGTAILITANALKDVIMTGNQVYRYDDEGLLKINHEQSDDKSLQSDFLIKIEKIPAKMDERILLFDPFEIDYIECLQGDAILSVRCEQFASPLTITELEQRLETFGFFRSHRSYLVNLQRVREVVTWSKSSYSLCLDDKCKSNIPLSKGRLMALKERLKI